MKFRFAPPAKKVVDDEDEQEAHAPEEELKVEKRTKSLDPNWPYIPRIPTTGWMLSELERHGFSLRGQNGIMKKRGMLVKMLRDLGYDVYAGENDAKRATEDR